MIPVIWDWAEWVFLYVPVYIFIAAMIGQRITITFTRNCKLARHQDCEHYVGYIFGALWPLAIALTVIAVPAYAIWTLGTLTVSPPAMRRRRLNEQRTERREWRERQRQAVLDDMEEEAWGLKECKYCHTEIVHRGGRWRTSQTSGSACPEWNNKSRAHQPLDELDAKEETSKTD